MFDYSRKPVKWQVGNFSKYNSWLSWLEKQGEQKPADKVEPKFKKE